MSGVPRSIRLGLLAGLSSILLGAVNPPSEPQVKVQVLPGSEQLEIYVTSNQPLAEPVFRRVGKPAHIELVFSHSGLLSRGGHRAVDRGVLQNVDVQSEAGGVHIALFSLSAPSSHATISADRKSLLWTVMTNVPATGSELPALRTGSTAHAHPIRPLAVKPRPSVTEHPAPVLPSVVVAHPVKAPVVVVAPARPPVVVAAPVKTVAVAQPTPVRQPVTPVRQPVTPVRQPVTPVPVASNPSDRLVSLTYPGGDLAGALRALAKAAGIQAQIDPGVSGYVTESFTDMPLNQAVTSVLGRQTELYNYKITATALIVTAPSGSSGGATLHSTAATGTAQVSDYFPIKLKPVADVYQAAHRAFPELTYQVDERLNVLFAEGDPAIMERLRKLLQNVSAK